MRRIKIKGNVLHRLFFNRSDERAYGRFAFFFDSLMQAFSNIFTQGAFYTAFLRLNDISMADMGLMTYMPIIANISCLFSPFVFRNIKKRKGILMAARMAYYFVSLCGVAFVPLLFENPRVRMYLMAFLLSFANVIWGIFVGGFSDWLLKFLPQDGTREEFYAYQGVIIGLFNAATQILAGFVAAAIETLPLGVQGSVLIWLRLGSFFFILIDVLVFLRAKEYPYPQSDIRLRIKDVFVLPMRHKQFRAAILLRALMQAAAALTLSSWTYYLMDVGISYSTLSFLGAIPPLLSLVLTPLAVRLFRRMGCTKNLFFYRAFECGVYFLYACICPANVAWLYPLAYVILQIVSVGINIADTNFVYLFMPEEDRLTYYSFYYMISSLASFLGSFLGAQYIILLAGRGFSLLGIPLTSVQMLMLIQAVLCTVATTLLGFKKKRLAAVERI